MKIINYIKKDIIYNSITPLWYWIKNKRLFGRFVSRLSKERKHSDKKDNKTIYIILQPWLFTVLPWYLIVLGLNLYRNNRNVIYVIDDTDLYYYEWKFQYQLNDIKKAIARLEVPIKAILLSQVPIQSPLNLSEAQLETVVRKNLIIRSRGEDLLEKARQSKEAMFKCLEKAAGKIQFLLTQQPPQYIILGGGGFNTSGLWVEMSKMLKIRAATIDSGFSVLLVSTNGVAAYLDDIPRAVQLLGQGDDWVMAVAQTEMQRRMQGKDQFHSQAVGKSGQGMAFDVLMPLNLSFDLAGLERHRVFASQMEWLLETVAWILENSRGTVVVRRHPVERFKHLASNDDYAGALARRFGDTERVRYIAPQAEVNTYDLIEQAKVVVPYVSTVGIEAAALGKPVITEGASCYSGLGFVWSANTAEEYFGLLHQALAGELKMTAEKKEAAWRCYYLTQCCNWLHTTFTPQAGDFKKWVIADPEEVISSWEVANILNAIDSNIPLAIINHRERKSKREQQMGKHLSE